MSVLVRTRLPSPVGGTKTIIIEECWALGFCKNTVSLEVLYDILAGWKSVAAKSSL